MEEDTGAILYGQLTVWPSKEQMAGILRDAGLRVYVGRYSVRVEDCSHFSFEQYGGDISEPAIDAGADSVETLKADAVLVSNALKRAGIQHRFEIYDSADKLVGYFHFEWPPPESV